MKLTSELLTGVYQETEELRRLDIVMENHELFAELEALGQQIEGATGMIEDLVVARDSLKAVGYSTEWFDCINSDNNFMMVVKPDLQNFFGGNETKEAACESAIIDTIKRWAKQVWEWIKQVFSKIARAIKAFVSIWAHKPVDSKPTIDALNRCVNIATTGKAHLFAQCFDGIVWRDPVVLRSWLESFDHLYKVMYIILLDAKGCKVTRGSDGSVNRSTSPLPPDQVKSIQDQMLADYEGSNKNVAAFFVSRWMRAVQTDSRLAKKFTRNPTVKDNGFAFISGGTNTSGTEVAGGIMLANVFTDDDQIPRAAVDTANPIVGQQAIASYIKESAATIKIARAMAEAMTGYGMVADNLARNTEKDYTKMLAHPGIAPDDRDLRAYQMLIVIFKSFTEIFSKLERRCIAIANGLERNVLVIQTNLAQFEKSVTGQHDL